MHWLWVIIIGFLAGVIAKWFVPGPHGFIVTTLLGIVGAQSGRIALSGNDLVGRPAAENARAGIGYVPQGRGLFAGLRSGLTKPALLPAGGRMRSANDWA